jgi:hypothetical protein
MSNNKQSMKQYKSPEEMAQELIDKFSYSCRECNFEENAIDSALTMVNHIISMADKNKIVYSVFQKNNLTEYTEDFYWYKVKKAIIQIQGGNNEQ